MEPERPALPEEMERFLAYLETERRASPHTRKAYRVDLEQYAAALAAAGAPLVPGTPAAIRRFLSSAAGSAGAVSLARKLSAIRSLYRFLVREGLATSNPGRGVATPRRPRRLPEVLP